MSRPGSRAAKGRSLDSFSVPPPQPTNIPAEELVKQAFTTYRTLDPIRAAALQAAVRAWPYISTKYDDGEAGHPDEILEVAHQFEQYLAGEEADGQ
jgi:hypothetical protein